jgi:hypothetical protein
MDGPFYVDSRGPHNFVSGSTITLTNVLQAALPPGAYPVLGPNYFNWVGKICRIKAFGEITTGATPGNVTFNWTWGNGTSNTGTLITGVNVTGQANQTGDAIMMEQIFRCRSCGVSGSLFSWGNIFLQNWGEIAIPPFSPAPTTLDLTQNNIIHLQVSRSGSTGESVRFHDITFEAMN